jgi:SprT protein
MAFSDESLIDAAQRVANVYARIANKKFGCNLPIPVPLNFDLADRCPSAAGTANHKMMIEINMVLFRDNIDHILNETIPHEIAHLIHYDKFDREGALAHGHGAEWREVMRLLGKVPNKFHNLDVSKAIKHFKLCSRIVDKIE